MWHNAEAVSKSLLKKKKKKKKKDPKKIRFSSPTYAIPAHVRNRFSLIKKIERYINIYLFEIWDWKKQRGRGILFDRLWNIFFELFPPSSRRRESIRTLERPMIPSVDPIGYREFEGPSYVNRNRPNKNISSPGMERGFFFAKKGRGRGRNSFYLENISPCNRGHFRFFHPPQFLKKYP